MKTPYEKFNSLFWSHDQDGHHAKSNKNLPQNQKADDTGTWFVAFGMSAYQVCSNNDPRLSLNYQMSRSNLPPNAL